MVSTDTVAHSLGYTCETCGAPTDQMTVTCERCPSGYPEPSPLQLEFTGDPHAHAFTFYGPDGHELLRINPDGTVYREGREIGTDEDVFRALQKWARAALGGQK